MTAPIASKAWEGLQARAALLGLQLFRTDPLDGPQRAFLVASDGRVRAACIDDLEDIVVASSERVPA